MFKAWSNLNPSHATAKYSVASFKRNTFSVENDERPGTSISLSTIKHIDLFYDMILANRRIGVKHNCLKNLRFHKNLYIPWFTSIWVWRKHSVSLIPKCYNAAHKQESVEASPITLLLLLLLNSVINMNEFWFNF